MAVYAPGDTPPVDPNADPGMWARLMGFVGGLNPIGGAQAAEAPPQGPGPPVDPDAAARRAAIERLKPMMASPGNTNTPAIMPHMFGDGPNVQGRPVLPYIDPRTGQLANAAAIPTNLPPGAPSPARPGGIGSDANFPVMGAGGFPTTYAPPGQQPPVPTPVGSPAPAVPPPRPRIVAQPVRKPVRIPASATASVPAAGSPWVTRDAQNQDWSGGALARGGTRQMGMLDLSKLFGQR